MILVDANLLVYAHVATFPQHQKAASWLDEQLNAIGGVGLAWPSLLAFLRLVTNPRVFERPEPIDAAWGQVAAWLEVETTWIPHPTEHHSEVLRELLAQPGISGNLVPDAHLAALAIEHGLALCSSDGDFARFRRLRWIDPLRNS